MFACWTGQAVSLCYTTRSALVWTSSEEVTCLYCLHLGFLDWTWQIIENWHFISTCLIRILEWAVSQYFPAKKSKLGFTVQTLGWIIARRKQHLLQIDLVFSLLTKASPINPSKSNYIARTLGPSRSWKTKNNLFGTTSKLDLPLPIDQLII